MRRVFAASLAGFAIAFLSATAQTPTPTSSKTGAPDLYERALPSEPAARDKLRADIDTALASPARSLDHRLRDDRREVRSIVAATRLQEGQRALDVGAGGGYLALILAQLVGPNGHVDIHNTPGWIAQFPSMDPPVQAARLKAENIGFVTSAWDRIEEPADSYDAIVMGQVYHDAVLEGANFAAMNQNLFALLKPSGRLVIEDHVADPAMPISQQVVLHRIAVDAVSAQVEAAGFRRIDLLGIPSRYDDNRFNVFRPGLRGRTERFILVFEKPAD